MHGRLACEGKQRVSAEAVAQHAGELWWQLGHALCPAPWAQGFVCVPVSELLSSNEESDMQLMWNSFSESCLHVVEGLIGDVTLH